jgi:hypothetical protein
MRRCARAAAFVSGSGQRTKTTVRQSTIHTCGTRLASRFVEDRDAPDLGQNDEAMGLGSLPGLAWAPAFSSATPLPALDTFVVHAEPRTGTQQDAARRVILA